MKMVDGWPMPVNNSYLFLSAGWLNKIPTFQVKDNVDGFVRMPCNNFLTRKKLISTMFEL